jgi:ArsR family transcriptional regulator
MDNMENILSAFSQEIRLRIALLLYDSSLCVNCLMKVLDLPQSTISRHLALMRRGGIVKVKRDSTHCYYTYDKDGPFGPLKKGLIDAYYENLRETNPFKDDRERLKRYESGCNADCEVGF